MDVTTVGIGRDPVGLARVARAAGVNVVMSTGYYVEGTHPEHVGIASEEDLVARMVTEIRVGAILDRADVTGQDVVRADQPTDIRAGMIKVGCSYPLTDNEKKVLRAAAETQRQTGAPITIHVGRHDQSALEIVEYLKSAESRHGAYRHRTSRSTNRTSWRRSMRWPEAAAFSNSICLVTRSRTSRTHRGICQAMRNVST